MVIFIVCLYLISITLFMSFIILAIVTFMSYSSIICLFASTIFYLIGYITFNKHTNKYPLNNMFEYYVKDFKKLLTKNDNYFEILFVKKDNVWICENNLLLVKLNLKGYAFEKSYLISYAIRNLRYTLISNKREIKYLFTNKLFIKKNFNVKLTMINENKRVEKMIVKNGISRYGFLPKHITFAPFYLSGLSNRHYQSIQKSKSFINEKKYKHFY